VRGVKRFAVMVVVVALAGCGGSEETPAERAAAPAPCEPAAVKRTPFPIGGERTPWVEGEPRGSGLTAVLAYWPPRWKDVTRARVVTGGTMPEGWNAKTMWIFVGAENRDRGGPELVIEGRNLTGEGTWRDTFAAISYEGQQGAPSYASIVDLPSPGCWRLTLTSGDLHGTVDLQAVAP